MGKKGDLCDFERGMVVGARRTGLNISKTDDLLGFSHTTISRVYYGGREVQNNITKCETLLRSSRQIYILENIYTYHKTQLHGKNTFTKDETNLHFRKQINKTQNTFTSPETNLQ